MLNTVNKDVLKKVQQIDNCKDLAVIIQRKIDEGHPIEYLDSFSQPCGTVGCVLGDWLISKKQCNDPMSIMTIASKYQELSIYMLDFGLNEDGWRLFGARLYGTYQDRLTLLNTHISTLESELAELMVTDHALQV